MLTIIIPYYKIRFFEACLQSLASQTDKRFKVYIGDDASPEYPKALLEKYRGKFDFDYHRFETNLGGTSLTQQWERCIALSGTEEWIVILGDDDVLGDNVVEEFYNNLEDINKEGSNVVKYATQVIDEHGKSISKVFQHAKLQDAAAFYYKRFVGGTRSSLSENIFKREVFVKHGFKNYPLAWHSDDYAWLSFAEKKPIYCINKAVLKISVSSESISGSIENLDLKNQAQALYFMDIVKHQLFLFTRTQRLILLYKAEVFLKMNGKVTQSEWNSLALGYCRNFSFVPIIKFSRRYLIQLTS